MTMQDGDENIDVTINLKMDQVKLIYNLCMVTLQDFDEDDFPEMVHFKKLRRQLQDIVIMCAAEELQGVVLGRADQHFLRKFGLEE